MTVLLHIVGPQGSGKSALAQMILRGCSGTACSLEWEDARRLTNQQVRERYAEFDLVCVEAMSVEGRHGDLQGADQVLLLSKRAGPHPAVAVQAR